MEVTTQNMQDRAARAREQLGPQLEEARAQLSEWNRRVTQFIRERPGTCLLGALAFGYVVGKLASRR